MQWNRNMHLRISAGESFFPHGTCESMVCAALMSLMHSATEVVVFTGETRPTWIRSGSYQRLGFLPINPGIKWSIRHHAESPSDGLNQCNMPRMIWHQDWHPVPSHFGQQGWKYRALLCSWDWKMDWISERVTKLAGLILLISKLCYS